MKRLMTGNEAVARGAYEAGASYASAYPGTPSTEILENIALYGDAITSEWAVNEKVALEAAIGASIAGARSLAAMKHVGVNVAADPLFTFAYTGVNGGLVLVSADDPGVHSSQNEQDNRYYAKFAKIPMLEPSDSQEAKDMTKAAFELSERFDTPVLLRMTTRVCHSKSPVEEGIPLPPVKKPYVKRLDKFDAVPAVSRRLRVQLESRLARLAAESNASTWNRVEGKLSKIGVVSSGVAYQYAREAFGDGASYFKLGMSFPLPLDALRDFASKVDKLYVVEELEPFVEEALAAAGIACVGKALLPVTGELDPATVAERMLGRSPACIQVEGASVVERPPVLCAGCPHRGFFYELSRIKDLMIAGDIGCYGLGGSEPLRAKDSCVCMGASVGMGQGAQATFRRFGERRRAVAVLGDSTFFHTGMNGLLNAVYNKSDTVVCILDNR
ncbi:MAG: thiamine pyrophosphate-dependent enzyme, partial [Spirochaetaceae bacterium]|nr:thiamine pyrophosphate-dependent enzyme [Spirochaetaceae bacterium]